MGQSPQYRFVSVTPAGTAVLCDWQTASECLWPTAGAREGVHSLRVDVRRVGVGDAAGEGRSAPLRGDALGAGVNGPPPTIPIRVAGIEDVVDVAVGSQHACALFTDGTVRCWGNNSAGQLGYGSLETGWNLPVSGLSNATQIVAGNEFGCALVEGNVWCWGDNRRGGLGDGTTENALLPTTISSLAGATNLTIGGFHACGMLGGVAHCWGMNVTGEVGDGTFVDRYTPTRVAF